MININYYFHFFTGLLLLVRLAAVPLGLLGTVLDVLSAYLATGG
jgi:hypothetical protein